MAPSNVQTETSGPRNKTSALPDSSRFAGQIPEDPFSGGVLMAVFDGKTLHYRRDTYFQAKLTTAKRIVYSTEDVYLLAFELNFMKSYSPQYRFRGADIDITVQEGGDSDSTPSITKIYPTIIAVDVSEREVQDTNEITVGATASAGPGQSHLSAKQTHIDQTNFTGRRKFHGLIKQGNIASWRLYEEPESQSGIPSIFRLVTLVQCLKGGFSVQLEVSARIVKGPKLLGLHNLFFNSSFSAHPTLHHISEQDQASRDESTELIQRVNKMMEISALDKRNGSETAIKTAGRSDTDDSVLEEQGASSNILAESTARSNAIGPFRETDHIVLTGGEVNYGQQTSNVSSNHGFGWGAMKY